VAASAGVLGHQNPVTASDVPLSGSVGKLVNKSFRLSFLPSVIALHR
jgi:hypothetical protein